ncbi:MAG: very short patch repair endonuclease [Methylobacter sp.]
MVLPSILYQLNPMRFRLAMSKLLTFQQTIMTSPTVTRSIKSICDTRGQNSDVMTPEQRSRCMSKIKGKNTGPEMRLRRALWAIGMRYRLNSSLPGRPDLVFQGKKLAVFVDGCFWHGCPEHAVFPKSNIEFWETKIKGNIARDEKINNVLEALGWQVFRIWEHEIKDNVQSVVDKITMLVR